MGSGEIGMGRWAVQVRPVVVVVVVVVVHVVWLQC